MTKKVAMLQPNYIPWKGVFDLIDQVDYFVFYDDVQYTRRDWRNRNKIRTHEGDIWLSVPVINDNKQLVCNTRINNEQNWQEKHHKSITLNYKKAPYFAEYKYLIDEIYYNHKWENLSDLNIFSTKLISQALEIKAEWAKSSDLKLTGDKNGEKIIKICEALNCNYFINGPSSKSFMDETLFTKHNIELEYINYSYPKYPQLHSPFNHFVTIFDLIFNCGKDSINYIRSTGHQL
jgi:hypothetical protein